MVAAEHDRQRPLRERALDEVRDVPARALDLLQEAGVRVALVRCLGDRALDVAPVHRLVAKADEPLGDPGVANRRRAHVDASAPRAETGRGAAPRDALAAG